MPVPVLLAHGFCVLYFSQFCENECLSSSRMRKRSGSLYATEPSSQLVASTKRARNLVRRREVNVGKTPIPRQLRNTLKYCQIVTITVNASGIGSTVLSCNGLYDPNITGAGHQPLYYDQMVALYNHYRVTASRLEVQFIPQSSQTFMGYIVQDDDTSLNAGAGYVFAERTGSKKACISSGIKNPSIKDSWSAKKVFPGDANSNDQLQGSSTSNPTEQTYWHVCVDGGTNMVSVTVQAWVFMEFDILWDEWVSVAES